MTHPEVELVYFGGCPHVEAAREVLRAALEAAGLPPEWREWDQEAAEAPERVQRYGSPTILVGGKDVLKGAPGVGGRACRVDGLPSAEAVWRVLTTKGK